MKRKFFAAFLSLCMVMSLVPMTALAAEDVGTQEPETGTSCEGTNCNHVAAVGDLHYDTLQGAVDAETKQTIILLQDVILTDGVEVDKHTTIDLNGHSISASSENWTSDTAVDYLLAVKRGGDLTIKDTVGSGSITTTTIACAVKMTIKEEANSGTPAKLTVYGGTIQGQYYGISGNGTRHDTEVTINGGTITSTNGVAIYQPQDGIMTINGGTIQSNITGIEIRSGSLTVNNGTISGGTGTPDSDENGSGTTTSNTGIAVAQHTTDKTITVTINGGTITGGAAIYESNPQNNTEDTAVTVSIADATLNGALKSSGFGTVTVDNATINGDVTKDGTGNMGITNSTITGNVTKDTSNTGSLGFVNSTIGGSAPENSNIVYVNTSVNGTIKNEAGNNEATVNGVPYNTLANAINAAKDGNTVTLLKDVNVDKGSVQNTSGILKITKDITLDGNSKKITVTGDGANTPSVINIEENANVTIKNLTIDSDKKAKHGLNLYNAGKVTVENVTIQNGTGYGIVCNSSDLTVNGLTTRGNDWGGINIDTSAGNDSNFTMTSGNIQEGNSVCIENGQEENITAQISGGSFKDVMLQNVDSNVDLDITGGSFNDVKEVTKTGDTTTENPTPSDMITISGGRFANDVTNYLADGLVQDSNGNVEKPYIPPANPNYKITIGAMENGTVTANPTAAKAGATVTLTPVPDEGYALSTLTVTDRFGDAVQVTENADGTYTFPMPNGQVTVTATFVETEEPVDEPFVDVAEGDWFYDAVVYAYQNELMDGVGGNRFAPNSETTRAQLVTILYRLEGQPAVSGDLPFTDVEAGIWYTDAILWAAQNNIVNGVSDTEFAPGDDLTRQQLVTILYRYAEAKGYDVSASADLSGYPDADQVQDYAQPAMAWAVAENIIQGMEDGTLKPAGNASRAQIATILMRFCEDVAQ